MKAAAYLAWLRKGAIAVAGALASYGFAIMPDSPGKTAVTREEWIGIAVAGLVAAGVIVAKNGPKPE